MKSIVRWPAIAIASIFVAQSALAQVTARVISFDRKVPIAERLRQDDTSVVVKLNPTVPFVGSENETWQEEITRLNNYDTIAVVRVIGAVGELVDGGTWIRTQLRTEVTQLVKGDPSATPNGFARMSHDGGTVRVGRAIVSTDAYPVFVAGDQYLVFLAFDRARKTTYPSAAFRVDAKGILAPLTKADGSSILSNSKLVGRPIEEVVAAFARSRQ